MGGKVHREGLQRRLGENGVLLLPGGWYQDHYRYPETHQELLEIQRWHHDPLRYHFEGVQRFRNRHFGCHPEEPELCWFHLPSKQLRLQRRKDQHSHALRWLLPWWRLQRWRLRRLRTLNAHAPKLTSYHIP